MAKIFILVDDKGNFDSKIKAFPYRSGQDKELLRRCFADRGYDVEYVCCSDVRLRQMNFDGKFVLYTSTEDPGYLYKGYIEDVVYAIHLQGGIVIPRYEFLRANNNKVFMELLRDISSNSEVKNLAADHYGTFEELKARIGRYDDTQVVKSAFEASSRGVHLAQDPSTILKKSKVVSRSQFWKSELWDRGRALKHKGYVKDSRFRKKFILQNFVPGLDNDWKILVFGNKFYVLHRAVKTGDFRASGSGNFEFRREIPDGMLNYAERVFRGFDIPFISIDIACDRDEFFLIEFQGVFFGKTTLEKSPFHFVKKGEVWETVDGESILEEEYANSVVRYIRQGQ